MKKIMMSNYSYLISLITSFLFLSSAAAQILVDTSGNPVLRGVPYYISSIGRGAAGGDLSLVPSLFNCPLDVIQTSSDLILGLPVTFHPSDLTPDGPINARANQKIQFTTSPIECKSGSVLGVRADLSLGRVTLSTGGVLGNPSGQDPNYWFKFEPYGPSGPETWFYFQYCLACEMCRMADQCANMTVVSDGRSRRLAVPASADEAPFIVNIRPVAVPASADEVPFNFNSRPAGATGKSAD
ncbi:Kunitz-like protease inhibitor [Striga asiatica]|uniref:Kunitz-like protease inhibitor n=1 Tax=Striga asiatica TaxID=4170 RepID=A0A5A7PC10_STRAF|nr:Kunitz-like protease inhibitor [Striga asiatica]